MKHMSLDEWDRDVAPILGAITIRTGWISRDVNQIKEWVNRLTFVPGFETIAMERLALAEQELGELHAMLSKIIQVYDTKAKST